jgi:hypothetical protein
MELKPVVHYNGGLTFEASDALTNAMADVNMRLLGIIFGVYGVFMYHAIKTFYESGKIISTGYVATEVVLAIIATLVACYQANRVRLIVVKIGKRVSITDEMVSIIPFTFGIFFWQRKPLYSLDFKIKELKIRKTDNPLWFTRALDNRVFELRDKQKEAFVVFDYFDETLKQKLTEILVEVTPPELLRLGRMRHY